MCTIAIVVSIFTLVASNLIRAEDGVFSLELTKIYLSSKSEEHTQLMFTNYQLSKYKPKNHEEIEVISTFNSNITGSTTMKTYLLQVPIYIGDPQQILFAVLDTGSANMLISTKECNKHSTDCPIDESNYFPDNSDSHISTNISSSIYFLCGELKAKVGKDSVTVGGVTVENQDIAEVIYQKGNCIEPDGVVGGIVGLSPANMKIKHTRTFLENIVKNKLLHQNIIAFYFPKMNENSKGLATFGGVDDNLYEFPIKYYKCPVSTYWTVNITSIKV